MKIGKAPRRFALLLGLPIAALVAIIAALLVIGGPSKARLERMDERRISDLSDLASAIERHHLFTGHLPESLAEMRERLEARGTAARPPEVDPETGAPYDYARLAENRFQICAKLALPDAAPAAPVQRRLAGSEHNPDRSPDRSSDRSMDILPQQEGNHFCLEGILRPG